ncbi:MAG: MBOAT family protein, partial [Lachnospiraceae bacterium]|nr:MBOAT family protein [Lachnospiraceae bacterium]
MNYISPIFAGFFVILIALYYLVPKKFQWHILLLGSLVFYLFSGPKYILYVLATAIITYAAAFFSEKAKSEKVASLIITLAVLSDLGIFLVLKYADFVLENINVFLPETGQLKLFSFILPLGLSFYTFSAVGYIVDVSRGKYKA